MNLLDMKNLGVWLLLFAAALSFASEDQPDSVEAEHPDTSSNAASIYAYFIVDAIAFPEDAPQPKWIGFCWKLECEHIPTRAGIGRIKQPKKHLRLSYISFDEHPPLPGNRVRTRFPWMSVRPQVGKIHYIGLITDVGREKYDIEWSEPLLTYACRSQPELFEQLPLVLQDDSEVYLDCTSRLAAD